MSYYAVVNGRIPGIYEDWHECQNQVHRFGYHKFKRFNTRRDAGDYMREYYDSDYESHYEFYDPDPLEMHIYTDGACRNNHLVMYGGSEAGYGVYFGRNDHRNQSALEYYFQDVTNGNEVYNIYTDSRYSINALTKWYRSWEKNGWVTLQGRDVANQQIIRECRDLIDRVDHYGGTIMFCKVNGHSGDEGNDMADYLARMGIDD